MKVEIDDPAFPKGTIFTVHGLGSLENGKSVEFSDEEVEAFEAEQGRSIEEAFAANQFVKVGGKKVFVEVETEDIKEEVT